MTLSARSGDNLAEQAVQLRRHLTDHPELELADVSYTLAVGRKHFEERASLVSVTKEQLVWCV